MVGRKLQREKPSPGSARGSACVAAVKSIRGGCEARRDPSQVRGEMGYINPKAFGTPYLNGSVPASVLPSLMKKYVFQGDTGMSLKVTE